MICMRRAFNFRLSEGGFAWVDQYLSDDITWADVMRAALLVAAKHPHQMREELDKIEGAL